MHSNKTINDLLHKVTPNAYTNVKHTPMNGTRSNLAWWNLQQSSEFLKRDVIVQFAG